MKLRLIGLVLCLAMVFPLVLSSCGNASTEATAETNADGTPVTTTTSNKAMTITLYSIKDESTTDEAISQVQAALNKITEKDYNTHILLKMYTEDEYDAVIDEKVEAIKEQKIKEEEEAAAKKAAEKAAKEAAKEAAKAAGGETTKAKTEETTTAGDVTIINEYGIEETVYPAENGTQLDIFLVRGMDKLEEYSADGLLTALDEQLSIGSKILKQYIHPTFLSAAKVGSSTYAIPNNHVVGEYKYLLRDKSLVDKYYYDPEDMNSLSDIEAFLTDVAKNEPDYIPLMNEPGLNAVYLTAEESLLGAAMPKNAVAGTSAAPKNLLSVTGYVNGYATLLNLRSMNAIGSGSMDDGNKYAAAVISGDPSTPELYKDNYYVSVYSQPTADNNNVYSGMYAVSTYAADVARCMDVVSLFTTSSEFVNIFEYGVEGMHYEIDEDTGLINRLNSDYSVNMNYAGNQFIMSASSDMTPLMQKLAENNWALAKEQNLDMAYNPYLGFRVATTSVDKEGKVTKLELANGMTVEECMEGIVTVSKDYLQQIADFKEYEEEYQESYLVKNGTTGEIEERFKTSTRTVTVTDFIAQLAKDTSKDEYIAAATDSADANSPASQYATWYAAAFPATEEAAPAA
ncbi:MAG: hypothetical protein WCQ72_00340 [Eubacteriales bacterium]